MQAPEVIESRWFFSKIATESQAEKIAGIMLKSACLAWAMRRR